MEHDIMRSLDNSIKTLIDHDNPSLFAAPSLIMISFPLGFGPSK